MQLWHVRDHIREKSGPNRMASLKSEGAGFAHPYRVIRVPPFATWTPPCALDRGFGPSALLRRYPEQKSPAMGTGLSASLSIPKGACRLSSIPQRRALAGDLPNRRTPAREKRLSNQRQAPAERRSEPLVSVSLIRHTEHERTPPARA
jgi:hypothetical protein